MVTGCLVATVVLAGCAAMAFLLPDPGIGDARILMGQDSGALYVRIDDVVHPVLNLASARLIAGAADNPLPVRESALRHTKRGSLLGIPGAPWMIGEPVPLDRSAWTVCDETTTTVIAGVGADLPGLSAGRTVLARSASSRTTWLLYDGKRAAVDLSDPVVPRALGLEGVAVREVSSALLNALVEVPALTSPPIPDRGGPGPLTLPGFAAGDVIRLERAGATDYYVVLTDGIQRIGRVAADLIRYADPTASGDITALAPEAIKATPTLGVLEVSTYPDRILVLDGSRVVCVTWTSSGSSVRTGSALPLASDQVPVPLAQADGGGPAADAVYLPPGMSMYVSASPGGQIPGGDYLVGDTGIRFGVPDAAAARSLGLPAATLPAPWPIVSLLPAGPELRSDRASVAHDVIPGRPA